jgi:GntR family transcriptional regulator/MocR family aminotransferase
MRSAAAPFIPLIPINRKSGRPLHRQIYDAFRSTIVERNLNCGQQIPSTRTLASELGISRIPVLNAYAQLLAEGYFETRTGAGTFVSSSLPDRATRSERRGTSSLQIASGPRRISGASVLLPRYKRAPWSRRHGAFSAGQPALGEFPLKAWANLVVRRARKPVARNLGYGDPMGLKELREVIAVYLRTARGVRCDSQQIMIVSGSQQALDLSARVLLNVGSSVWVEEPGYWLARHMLTAAGCRIVPVPVDAEGLDVAAGIKKCGNARAALVAPSHQYPLGVTMSASRRLQLLQWAGEAGGWIIEDDYDSEYRYESNPIASLQGLDDSCRVIYIGTFSKVLFPSLRIGYVVVPPDLVDHFLAMRHAMDVSPPHLYQAVLTDFIAEGHFARHIRRMRVLYSERRNILVRSLEREFGGLLQVMGDKAGMHLAVNMPKRFDDREIAMRAARESLWLWPLSPSYIRKPAHHGFILGFGSTTAAEIPTAVQHLLTLMDARRNPISATGTATRPGIQ